MVPLMGGAAELNDGIGYHHVALYLLCFHGAKVRQQPGLTSRWTCVCVCVHVCACVRVCVRARAQLICTRLDVAVDHGQPLPVQELQRPEQLRRVPQRSRQRRPPAGARR
jgi:hypothetical protein